MAAPSRMGDRQRRSERGERKKDKMRASGDYPVEWKQAKEVRQDDTASIEKDSAIFAPILS